MGNARCNADKYSVLDPVKDTELDTDFGNLGPQTNTQHTVKCIRVLYSGRE